MLKYVAITAFVVACLLQGIHFSRDSIIDNAMWASQTHYVEVGDSREFDPLQAYGHPGGPIILGTSIIHRLSGKSYDDSVLIFLTLMDSMVITAIVVICYRLRRDLLWCLAILGTLSLHPLYFYATPPSALAALLVTLLAVGALYLYERGTSSLLAQGLWSIVAGLAVATRTDIGSLASALLGLLLMTRIGFKRVALMAIGAMIVFCATDPFMWFMPIKHVQDLVSKVVLHYADFASEHITLFSLVSISSIAFISMLCAVVCLARREFTSPLPARYVLTILTISAILYGIVLTSHYQAERYFMPIIFIWETLFPLYLFYFISFVRFDFIKTEDGQERARRLFRIGVVLLLIAYPATSLPFLVG